MRLQEIKEVLEEIVFRRFAFRFCPEDLGRGMPCTVFLPADPDHEDQLAAIQYRPFTLEVHVQVGKKLKVHIELELSAWRHLCGRAAGQAWVRFAIRMARS